jgi:hypothetical protein
MILLFDAFTRENNNIHVEFFCFCKQTFRQRLLIQFTFFGRHSQWAISKSTVENSLDDLTLSTIVIYSSILCSSLR